MLSPDGRERLRDLRVKLVRSAYERRDVWATREEAWEDLKRKVRVRGSGRGLSGDVKGKGTRKAGWDERSLRVYVVSGFIVGLGRGLTDIRPYTLYTCCGIGSCVTTASRVS